MPVKFNTILVAAGFPLANVRLLRHKDNRADRGRTPYELWRDDRPQFESYQSTQSIKNREKLNTGYWASFVGTPNDETLFVGLYAVTYLGLLEQDKPMPHRHGVDKAGNHDAYELTIEQGLSDLGGKLFVDWGLGTRTWIQYADRQDKRIVELLREFKEADFPGFLDFVQPLSRIERLPRNWIDVLKSSKGVYLLTCPRTKEQYVGSATGEDGFWGRWQNYIETGHGGNVSLKSRDPSDYQVSILEVAGTAAAPDDIIKMEGRWQSKLQCREMGLNRNWAGGA